MAIRNIISGNDPILHKKARTVEKFDDRLGMLLDDLNDTLGRVEGLGLAAPQVGVLKRVFVVWYDDDKYEVVNPTIVKTSGSLSDNEGCLSVKGFRGMVTRPEHLTLNCYDRHGNVKTLEASGYFARVFLHEYDHLEGILFSDIMTKKLKDDE